MECNLVPVSSMGAPRTVRVPPDRALRLLFATSCADAVRSYSFSTVPGH